MATRIKLTRGLGGGEGFRGDLRFDRDLEGPVVVDATDLAPSHPMFLVRLRLFVDWHVADGRAVVINPPTDPASAGQLASMGLGEELVVGLAGPDAQIDVVSGFIPVRRLSSHHHVEEVAADAMALLHQQDRSRSSTRRSKPN